MPPTTNITTKNKTKNKTKIKNKTKTKIKNSKKTTNVRQGNNTQRVTVHVNSHNDGKGKSKEPTPYEFYSNYYNSLQPAAQPVPDYSNLFSQLAQSLQSKTQEKAAEAIINPYAAYDDYNATMMNYAPLTNQSLSNYNNEDRNDYVVPMPARTNVSSAPARTDAPSKKSMGSVKSKVKPEIPAPPSQAFLINYNMLKNEIAENKMMGNEDIRYPEQIKEKAPSKKSTGSVKSIGQKSDDSNPFQTKFNMFKNEVAENKMMKNEDIRIPEQIKEKVKAKSISKSKPDGAGGGGAAADDDAVVVPGNKKKKSPTYMKVKGQLFEHPADSGNWYEKDEIEQLYYGGKKQKSGARLRNYINHGKIDPASKKEEVEAFVKQQNLFDKNQPEPTDINDVWGKQIQLINQRTNPTNIHYTEGHKKLNVYKFDEKGKHIK